MNKKNISLVCAGILLLSLQLMIKIGNVYFDIFNNIYYTYYFNEGLILEAKFQEKEALTRSLRLIWALYGILVFLSFIATMSGIYMITIIANLLSLMFCIFYVSNIFNISKGLYMEGLPTKHMMQ